MKAQRRICLMLSALLMGSASPLLAASTERVTIGQGSAQGNDGANVDGISGRGRFASFESGASNLILGDNNTTADAFVRDRLLGNTERVSVSTGGVEGNGASFLAKISADGRYVAFRSEATNLVKGDTNGVDDVFVRDRTAGTTQRASVASSGAQANGVTLDLYISGNGRFVSLLSDASNLVAGDTNGTRDLFVRDLQKGTTSRADLGLAGAQCSGGALGGGAMSADGRFIAFMSACKNLVAGGTSGQAHVFLRDRLTGKNELVSRSSAGAEGNGLSIPTDVSADGRFVTFISQATNLVAGDTNGQTDVFLYDRKTSQTRRIDVGTSGAQANGFSSGGAISADDRYIVFDSEATNLVAGDTNGQMDTFLRDLATNKTSRVSVTSSGAQGNGRSLISGISADGKVVFFGSDSTNLVKGDSNGVFDGFVRVR